jgi:hypothetical protein
MKRLVALGISIGVLAGLYTFVAFSITSIGGWTAPFSVWIGFAAWAMFYAKGGGTTGLTVSGASTLSGAVWGWLIALAWLAVTGPTTGEHASYALLGVAVAIGAFAMCVQAAVPVLGFIPGAFVGAASYFGLQGVVGFSGPGFWTVVASIIGGTVLAFASEKGADVIEKMLGLPAGDPEQAGGAHQTPSRKAHA